MATQRVLVRSGAAITELVPNTVSAGSGDAGKVIALNSAGAVDATMMPAGVGANAVTATASATITAGQLINVYNNAGTLTVRPADQTSPSSQADGYAPAGITSGSTGTVNLGPGAVTGLTGLTIGSTYYLSTVGAITTTAPSTAGYIAQIVGKAVSASVLDFQPMQPITIA